MKKLLLVLMFFGLIWQANAQSDEAYNKSEIKLNILNTIIQGSVEVGYEYFVERNQSIGVEYLINDRFGYNSENDSKEYNTNSLLVSYNFYFLNDYSDGSLYVYPFFKYRFGDFQEIGENNAVLKTDMNSAMLGI